MQGCTWLKTCHIWSLHIETAKCTKQKTVCFLSQTPSAGDDTVWKREAIIALLI